jgi:hypothetical protein
MSGQLILGKDIANDKYVPISVDSTGHLDIDVQVADLDSKCMGSETGATDGTQHQLRVDNTGALHIVSENYDSVLIKGVDNGAPGVQRDCKQNANGDLRSALVGNTAKDGTGTNYYVVVDADGKLESTAGDATSANQATQIANQGTINTSIGTVNTSVGTVNSTLGDTNSKIDAMRGSSDLGVVNTSIGTVNSSVGDTNSKIDAMRASDSLTTVKGEITSLRTDTTDGSAKAKIMGLSGGGQYQVATDTDGHLQVDVLTGGGGGTQFAGEASLATTGTGTAMIGRDNTGTARLVAVDTAGNIQVDIVANADTTKATSTLQTAGNASLTSVDGKITACNTGAVVVSSSALPTGASTEATALLAEAHLGAIDTSCSSIQSNVSTSSNQGTMITSLSSLAGCVAGTELQVDIVTGGGGGTQFAGEASLGSTGTGTAMIGRDNTGTARLVAVDTTGNIQMDIVANADTTKATSTLQTAGNASLTSVAGCVSGTELQVDVKNRTDSAPVALTFSAGNKIIGASGTTRTGTIDVAGCSSYVIFMNMLVATTNSSELSNTDISIEYSPDDGSTFMGTSSSGGGGLETIAPLPLYQASGLSSAIVGYGVYIQSTASFSNPLMGVARTNKIRLAVQNPFAGTLTLDSFAIYKFN